MLGVALAGVAVNLAATMLIVRAGGSAADRHGAPRSLSVAGAFKHIVTDLYAFAATAVRPAPGTRLGPPAAVSV